MHPKSEGIEGNLGLMESGVSFTDKAVKTRHQRELDFLDSVATGHLLTREDLTPADHTLWERVVVQNDVPGSSYRAGSVRRLYGGPIEF